MLLGEILCIRKNKFIRMSACILRLKWRFSFSATVNQPTRAKSTLELLLTITEWQSKCLDCDFSTHLNVVFPSFFFFPTLVSPKLILCMLMWVFTVCIPYSESQPLQHLPAYQIRCMLICQYMLWLHNKKTDRQQWRWGILHAFSHV